MLLLTTLIIVVALVCVDGNERIVRVSELLVSDDEDFFTSGESMSEPCYMYENRSYCSLDHAIANLANLTSNVLINITTDAMLSSLTEVQNLENISIIGHNNPTVNCNNAGGIHFISCQNCTIQGITWNECGTIGTQQPGLKLSYSSNITIQNCSFQHSRAQAIVILQASGDVNINYCKFVNNTHHRGHGTAIYYTSNNAANSSELVFTIKHCNFTYNKWAKSLVYIENSIFKQSNEIFFHYLNICFNKGVMVYMVNHHIHFNGRVLFCSNAAENGAGIYIKDYSTIEFGENSDVEFTNVTFLGGHIFFSNNTAVSGGAVYSNGNNYISFKENSTAVFSNNIADFGGGIYSYNGYISFEGNSNTVFSNNTADFGVAINLNVKFNNNAARWRSYGGQLTNRNTDITIDSNGTIKCSDHKEYYICKYAICYCRNLKYISDNTAVIITENMVLSSMIKFTKLVNISLIGHNNPSVSGGFQFISCSNVTVAGITWTSSPLASNSRIPQLNFTHSSNIVIDRCTFHHLIGKVVALLEVSGAVSIKHCKFMNNQLHREHDAAIHYLSNCDKLSKNHLTISNSNFSYNKFDNASIIFLESHNNSSWCGYTVLHNSNFDNNHGVCMYLSNQKLYLTGDVLFQKNAAENGAGLFITEHSNVIFDNNSDAKFAQNNAAVSGGAIYLNNWSTIVFNKHSNVIFSRNKAKSYGGASYSFNNSEMIFKEYSRVWFDYSTAELGGSLYTDWKSNIIFKEYSNITISNNKATQGGAIYSKASSNVKFENNTIVVFYRNEAIHNGGCIYTEDDSNILFKGTCEVTFNMSVVFNGAGGAIYCASNSGINFKVDSKAKFYNSIVYNGEGGAVYFRDRSVAIFEGSSDVVFYSNKATDGGAVNFYLNSNLILRNNTNVTFANNSATMGGAVNFHLNSNCTIEKNSILMVIGNSASQNGGGFHLEGISYLKSARAFQVQFDSNEAVLGGAVYCSEGSKITFTHLSNTILTRNKAERGGAIFLTASRTVFNSSLTFNDNTATKDGGAFYLDDHSNLIFLPTCNVTFFLNTVSDYGGAIYAKMDQSKINFNSTYLSFHNNNARTAGNSIYINVPRQCNGICLTDSVLGINSTKDLLNNIVTSPQSIKLYNSKVRCINYANDSGCNSYLISNIMLGEKILMDACLYDYYNKPVDAARFSISGPENHGFVLGSNNALISCNRTFELVHILGNKSYPFNYSIKLSLHDNHQSEFKEIFTNLTIELSTCHPGYWYHEISQKCECYNGNDIVFCSGSSSAIKGGYWFGSVSGNPTVTCCPMNYCNFTCCGTSNGYYHLTPVRDNQCTSHRSGTACGSCTYGYTLSFDSTKCVNIESCTAGHKVLVILLTVIYWLVMVAVVFAMMYFKINIGYLYSITYYYSIVDILLSQILQASRGLYLTVSMMSSFSKITPQFLGEFCLTPGMSGIDQQLIHYMHPLAIILILITISLLARNSRKFSAIISRGIIHVICLFLLLSYTSVVSTSLLLLRPLKFVDVDEVYTYLSPDIEYFRGRHLAYGIVALLCTVPIVIGLPLLLTLEPFVNHKINFTKIKPLLDQFQGCYKDKYRCFAGYYMSCRVLIITIFISNSSNDFIVNYMLIIVCGIIALIHLLVKPYNNRILNKLDGITLQLIIFIVALPLFDDIDSTSIIIITLVLVMLPLLIFIVIILFLHKDDLKKIIIKFTSKDESTISNDVTNNIKPVKEFSLVVDDSTRKHVTICDV